MTRAERRHRDRSAEARRLREIERAYSEGDWAEKVARRAARVRDIDQRQWLVARSKRRESRAVPGPEIPPHRSKRDQERPWRVVLTWRLSAITFCDGHQIRTYRTERDARNAIAAMLAQRYFANGRVERLFNGKWIDLDGLERYQRLLLARIWHRRG